MPQYALHRRIAKLKVSVGQRRLLGGAECRVRKVGVQILPIKSRKCYILYIITAVINEHTRPIPFIAISKKDYWTFTLVFRLQWGFDWTSRYTRLTHFHFKYKCSPVNRPCVQILAGRRLQSPSVQSSRHRVSSLQLPGFWAHIFQWLHRNCKDDWLNFIELIQKT